MESSKKYKVSTLIFEALVNKNKADTIILRREPACCTARLAVHRPLSKGRLYDALHIDALDLAELLIHPHQTAVLVQDRIRNLKFI